MPLRQALAIVWNSVESCGMLRSRNSTDKRSERLTCFAAAGSALATLACCVPTCFGAAAATAGIGLVMGTAQPWLLAASVVLLGVGWCEVYSARDRCVKRSRRTTLGLLWFSAVVVALVIADWLQ